MNDTFKKGIIAGLLGTAGDAVIHWTAYYLWKTTTTAHYIAQLMFPVEQMNLVQLAIGLLAHFIAGALAGIILVLLLKRLGNDHAVGKGIGFAVFLWIVHVIIIPNLINNPRPVIFRTETECIVDLLAHLAYGFIAVFYLNRNV